jgi:glycosyltransferase involved in cell wall biosynthesis
MRVLHLLKTSVGAIWALRQIRELVKLGIDVHVVLPGLGPMIGSYADIGATEHLVQTDFPALTPWTFPSLAGMFRQLVKKVQPDIIHSHFVGTTLTMRLALGRNHLIPRVFQVPGPLHLEHSFFRITEIATAGSNDYWIGACQWTCARYRASGINDDRIFLSYYGTDLNTFTGCPGGSLRRELGLNAQTKIVGMVAFMYAPKRYLGQKRGLKGHEDLVDAMAICLRHFPDMVCVIIGGAWNNAIAYEQHVREYAAKRCGDRLILLGTRHDVPQLYPDIDIAVHPSLSENAGGAVESLLNAVPTIATNIGGFPDLVKHGETGWLVPPSSPQQLAETIIKVFKNPTRAKELAVRGQSLAMHLFDVKRNAREIVDIYRKVLSRN